MGEISYNINIGDRIAFKTILESSSFFYDFEVELALSLLDEAVEKGQEESGYFWIKLIDDEKVVGFANFGPNPCSTHSWELYWLAVHEKVRNKHYGKQLLAEVEKIVADKGGKFLWIETAGRSLYEPTRHFYLNNGYDLVVTLEEFYGPGDAKLIFRKELVSNVSKKTKL